LQKGFLVVTIPRNGVKVDLRTCFKHNNNLYDVCNIEFARNGDVEKKCLSDATKLALGGKCILDQIAKVGKLDVEEANSLQVYNLQFCGKLLYIQGTT
jgi:hypothetical protein